MSIQIRQEQHDRFRILALKGRLDTETAADVELAFEDLLQAGDRHFLVDLAGIGYVSSAGLRVLLAVAKKLEGDNGSLRLCALTPAVRQVFDVAGFSKLFAISPDRATALAKSPAPAGPVRRAVAAPSHPLAEPAARILGIKSPPPAAAPQSFEMAQTVARVLGLSPVATGGANAGPIRASRPAPVRASTRPRAPAKPSAADGGIWGRLKRLFGGKR